MLVSATHEEFEASVGKDGQIREQLTVAYDAEIRQMVIAVNKMDAVNWSENRFLEIQIYLQN